VLDCRPDYGEAKKRIDAFWECEVVDRALTFITYPRPESQCVPLPDKTHTTVRDRWMDVDYQVEQLCARIANTVYVADAIPLAVPNLGPAIFAAACGCELGFARDTTWTIPFVGEWDPGALSRIALDPDNEYYKAMAAITRGLSERGKDRFLVGVASQLGGGDALAAFRGPESLCLDLVDHPEQVGRFVKHFARLQCEFYDVLWEIATRGSETPSGGWLGIISDGRCYVPQNDFSAMVSPEMFREILAPATALECAHMDRCIYHLDGLQALNHLDAVLEIPNVHALQWGPPPQRWDWHEWVPVYKQIQDAGKGFIVYLPAADLDEFIPLFRPQGAWLHLGSVANKAEADEALRIVERWGV